MKKKPFEKAQIVQTKHYIKIAFPGIYHLKYVGLTIVQDLMGESFIMGIYVNGEWVSGYPCESLSEAAILFNREAEILALN